MKKKEIREALEGLRETETLAWVHRKFDGRWWRGYVVGIGDEWVLVHEVQAASLTFNGYMALRLSELATVRPDKTFVPYALKLRGERPRPQLDLLLSDLPGLLSSAGALFPLVAVFRERKPSGGCYIGRPTDLRRKKFGLRAVDRYGAWGELHDFKYADITRVDLGDGYLEGLWLVAGRQRREAR